MFKRTKIVTTLGPATDNEAALEQLFKAGANVVRMNFSHGSPEDHLHRTELVRKVSQKMGIEVAILGDLQGPKIRIAKFKDGKIKLEKNAQFILDAEWPTDQGNNDCVGIDYKELPKDCKVGDRLLLDDGRVVLEITDIDNQKVVTTVIIGGALSNNKGINLQGGGLSAPALTDKDKKDIELAAQMEVDYLAVSFPRSADDMKEAETLLRKTGSKAGLVAKIERAEVVNSDEILDQIILASDAVMVARGDLGVEIGDAELIGVQKKIIARARTLDRIVITATQMMESMISNAIPTRAEVFDVANAVLDGTDAVMLSAETATGEHPILVVEAMARVCQGAEKQKVSQISKHRMEDQFQRIDEAIAMATMYAANHLRGVKAICCLTESGSTALWMSRIRSGMPIYALSPRIDTRRRIALYRGVEGIHFDPKALARHDINRLAVEELKKRGIVEDGDLVLLTKGDSMGILGSTNAMKILQVGSIA
ncbi:pyruvate kinase [Pleionea litopenaei]|uniref:Pyruvate kinase n=1 Tax=Pleionea litopenaei TaxID=3070815 RepID=A0AA51RV20_9GAMM|nr:pyruvate kinase [Pleionea sp. HL-JVS1]WMS88003.1 pyruvate kinase [Pleionea sp. HL-JVS1]